MQWYRTKLFIIVLNTHYFKPIILKFKIFIHKSNSKVVQNFCICLGNASSYRRKNTIQRRNFSTLAFFEKIRKTNSWTTCLWQFKPNFSIYFMLNLFGTAYFLFLTVNSAYGSCAWMLYVFETILYTNTTMTKSFAWYYRCLKSFCLHEWQAGFIKYEYCMHF